VQRSMTLLRYLLLIAENVAHINLLPKMELRDTDVNASCSYQVVWKQRTTSSFWINQLLGYGHGLQSSTGSVQVGLQTFGWSSTYGLQSSTGSVQVGLQTFRWSSTEQISLETACLLIVYCRILSWNSKCLLKPKTVHVVYLFVLCISAYETPSAVPPMQLIKHARVAATSLHRGSV
jgi:hypothetical protein